jgi:hypothetical protein
LPAYQALKLQGDTLKIYAVAARADRAGPHRLSYDNRYRPAASRTIANIFLKSAAGWRYRVVHQQRSNDGRRLSVDYTITRP